MNELGYNKVERLAMKKLSLWILPVMALLFITGCDSGGAFRVINQTSYPLYVKVDEQDEVTIPGNADYIFEIETEKESIFNPDVEKKVPVWMIGETFQIYDDYSGSYTDSTTITIKVNKTTNAYIQPNRASIKVVNDSDLWIAKIDIYKHNFIGVVSHHTIDPIAPHSFNFKNVDYVTPNNNFYYFVLVELEDGTRYQFGGENVILQKDEQFLVTVINPQ